MGDELKHTLTFAHDQYAELELESHGHLQLNCGDNWDHFVLHLSPSEAVTLAKSIAQFVGTPLEEVNAES